MKPVEIFHIGPQKTATTWVYRCMREHPEVACPPKDTIHYFDMFYSKGREWYAGHFREAKEGQKLFDPTPSYIRSHAAPRRIAQENPEARIVLCLRNPIDRAFSHYWHEKKKRRFNFRFSEVLEIYDLYSNWLEPGFYAEHIERYLAFFPREQLLCQRFDNLQEEPRAFLRQLFGFVGIDADFTPSMLHRKINVAGSKKGLITATIKPRVRTAFRWLRSVPRLGAAAEASPLLTGKNEYVKGIPGDLLEALEEVCEPEIARLERLLDIDLQDWRGAGRSRERKTEPLRESMSPQR